MRRPLWWTDRDGTIPFQDRKPALKTQASISRPHGKKCQIISQRNAFFAVGVTVRVCIRPTTSPVTYVYIDRAHSRVLHRRSTIEKSDQRIGPLLAVNYRSQEIAIVDR